MQRGKLKGVSGALLVAVSVCAAQPPAFSYDYESRKADVLRQFQDGSASGRLDASELDKLNSMINKLNNREAGYRVSGGKLDDGERVRLIAEVEKINLRLQKDLRDNRRIGWRFWRWWW